MKKPVATYKPFDFIPAVEVAKLVRQALKETFGKEIKFRVITRWEGLNQGVFVSWTKSDLSVKEVKSHIGHFHGAEADQLDNIVFRKTTWRGHSVQFGNAFIRMEQK